MISRSGCGIPSKIQLQVTGKHFEDDVLCGHPVLQRFILPPVPTWRVARHVLAKRMEDESVRE
jgi:hypothetical protein